MLLFLVKHSRPDLANAVWELSKCMGGASEAAFQELKRVVKFTLDTKEFGLKLKPKQEEKWVLETFVDANWAGDTESRISISGYVMMLNDSLIGWRSQAQRNVTLSSGESEYVSLSDAVKEVKYVHMLCGDMGINLELPMVIRIDNVGAMFMAETASASNRTRHIDVKYHHVRETIAEGLIKLVFVESKKNLADIFTKNVNKAILELHQEKMIGRKGEIENHDSYDQGRVLEEQTDGLYVDPSYNNSHKG